MTPTTYMVEHPSLGFFGPFDTREEAFAWAIQRDLPIVIHELHAP